MLFETNIKHYKGHVGRIYICVKYSYQTYKKLVTYLIRTSIYVTDQPMLLTNVTDKKCYLIKDCYKCYYTHIIDIMLLCNDILA